jgi:hypothetical protein
LPNNPVWYGGSSIIIVTQMVLDPPGVRNCLKKGFILEFRPIRQVSEGQKSKNMEMTRTNMMLLFVGRKKKKAVAQKRGVFKHSEVARSSRRAPPHGAPGSRIPPDQKQAVLQQLAPSQPQGSAGPTSQAAIMIHWKCG